MTRIICFLISFMVTCHINHASAAKLSESMLAMYNIVLIGSKYDEACSHLTKEESNQWKSDFEEIEKTLKKALRPGLFDAKKEEMLATFRNGKKIDCGHPMSTKTIETASKLARNWVNGMEDFDKNRSKILAKSNNKPINNVNLEMEGNLEASNPVACIGLEKLKSSKTPADTFAGVTNCMKEKKYSLAAELFLGSLLYGVYDSERVSDKTAHQAILMLRMKALSGEPKDRLDRLQNEINILRKGGDEICQKLIDRGQPQYHPRYMVQHGIKAFDGPQENRGIVEDFDAQKSWKSALLKVASCELG